MDWRNGAVSLARSRPSDVFLGGPPAVVRLAVAASFAGVGKTNQQPGLPGNARYAVCHCSDNNARSNLTVDNSGDIVVSAGDKGLGHLCRCCGVRLAAVAVQQRRDRRQRS